MADFAQLAAEAGGSETKGTSYADLAKAHGGTLAAERAALDKEVTNENYSIPGTETRIPHTGTVNQFLISTGRGMVDLWQGANQVARIAADTVSPRQTKLSDLVVGGTPTRNAEYTREVTPDLQQFSKLETEAPVTSTLGRMAGQVAPTLAIPPGSMAAGVRAAGSLPYLSRLSQAGFGTDAAMQGGLLGFLNFTQEDDSRAGNTALGAVAGGAIAKGFEFVGRAVSPLVQKGADWLTEKVGRSDLATLAGTRAGTTSEELAGALKKEGIDWSTLSQEVRDGVKAAADDAAKAGAPVTPAELARVVRAQNLPGGPAELTKGQMTGNRSQLRDEFNLRRTRAGQTLDDQLVQQDKVLADSLDVIKLRTGGETTAGREAEAGQKITQPLLDQLKAQQGKVTALYKAADESGQTLTKVDPTALIKWVEDNYAAMHSAPAMKSLVADLKKSGLVTFSEDGVATAGREPTIREVESLRQAMVKWGKADGASGAYMGEAKRVLDGITEGKGGELYGKARAARIELREKFEDPGVINRLVSEKPGGDRVTAFEDVFKKSVLDSSVDDLTVLRGQLLGGANTLERKNPAWAVANEEAEKLHGAGVQAFKDLRAATLDFIKLSAVNNAKDEFSYAGLKRAVDTIGPEKLEVLFGKNTANQLLSVVESAKDMKAAFNKSGVYNPGTASALVDWIDKITGIVGLGKAGTYGRLMMRGGAQKIMETMNEPRLVQEASKPVQAAMQAGEAAKADLYRQLVGMYAGKAGAMAAPGVAAAAVKPEASEQ